MIYPGGRTPQLSTHMYTTFQIASPLNTHYRKATCQEVDCESYLNGWTLDVNSLSAELLHTATHSGRRFRRVESLLIFEAGQPCFAASQHRVSLERPEFYFEGRGDFRSYNARSARQFKTAEDWVDRFATHQDKIKTAIQRG